MTKMYELTGAELDAVSGGALITLTVADIANNSLNNNDVTVGIPIDAAVSAAILGASAAGAVQRGRIT